MEGQAVYYILGIFGSLVFMGLTVNAYFVRSLLESINKVNLQVAVLVERSESKERRIEHIEDDVDELKEKYHEVVVRISNLN